MHNELKSDNVVADVIKTSRNVAIRSIAVGTPFELKESSIPYPGGTKATPKATVRTTNAVLRKTLTTRTTHK